MAIWSTNNIQDINEGIVANDGTGDSIRDAFLKVDENFYQISSFLAGNTQSILNAQIVYNLEATTADITNLVVGNITGTTSTFEGNITGNNLIANTTLYSHGTTILSGDVNANNVYTNGVLHILGNASVSSTIAPAANVTYDLGSPTNFFKNIYAQTLVTSQQVNVSSDAGLLQLHANLSPGDVKDVGILGKFHDTVGNAYAFFGYQHETNNFVYKITPTDATAGNSVVYDGVYGNAHLGSLFLSNVTSGNTMIVAGNGQLDGNLYVAGNVFAAGNAVITTATIESMVVTGNVLGNLNVSGTLYSNGSKLLSTDTAGPYTLFSGGIVLGNVNIASTFNATSQTSAGLVVGGGIGVGGNVFAGGLIGPYYGTIQTSSQPNITGVGTLGNLSVAGTINATQLQATQLGVGQITATGINTSTLTVSGSFNAGSISSPIIGNAFSSIFGNTITATSFVGNVSGANGVFTTANVGSISAGTINPVTIGNAGSSIIGTISTSAQPNITSVGTLNSLTVAGNTNGSNFNGTFYGNSTGSTATFGSATITGNIVAGNISSTNGSFTNIAGTIITASQPNITSIGATGLTVAGNTAVNNTLYARGVFDNGVRVVSTSSGAGNLTISGSAITLTLTGPGAIGAGSATDIPIVRTDAYGRVTSLSTVSASTQFRVGGSSGSATLTSAGNVSATGVLTFTSTNGVTSAVTQANATSTTVSISTPQDLRVTATPTFSGILPSANVTSNLGSSTMWWNNIYGTAIHAQYADLAEKYESDSLYEPGTVVIFGGDKEVTTTLEFADTRVAGAVSTEPAYLMNAETEGVAVALRGRVPVKVDGPVIKGDLLVTALNKPGYATSVGRDRAFGLAVFAKALETNTADGEKVITAVII